MPFVKTAYELCQYESSDHHQVLKKVQKIVDERLNKNSQDSIEERRKIKKILDLFEHMGQDVRLKVADEIFLKDMFFNVVINYYEILALYIASIQIKYNNDNIYCNFIHLAQIWKEWRLPPKLPSLCPKIDQIKSNYQQAYKNIHPKA